MHNVLMFLQPASARGIGIQVIHKWSQMPRKRPLLVQKYAFNPYSYLRMCFFLLC